MIYIYISTDIIEVPTSKWLNGDHAKHYSIYMNYNENEFSSYIEPHKIYRNEELLRKELMECYNKYNQVKYIFNYY